MSLKLQTHCGYSAQIWGSYDKILLAFPQPPLGGRPVWDSINSNGALGVYLAIWPKVYSKAQDGKKEQHVPAWKASLKDIKPLLTHT